MLKVTDEAVVVGHSGGNGAGAAEAGSAAVSVADRAAQIKAQYEARLLAKLEEAMSGPGLETAEPLNWWDLAAFGPIQIPAGVFGVAPVGPYEPSRVVRVGETAYMVTALVLNTNLVGGIIPANILSGAALPYEIHYATLNMSTGAPTTFLNVRRQFDLNPGQAIYVSVEPFVPDVAGCIIETNVCARILNCDEQTPAQWPFAGFATWINNPDTESFLAGLLGVTAQIPGFIYDHPARYLTFDT